MLAFYEKGFLLSEETKLLFLYDFTLDLLSISVLVATRKGLMVSTTLPYPQGYLQNHNPILECCADQMNHDINQKSDSEKISGLEIWKGILKSLCENRIRWPEENNINSNKWEWLRRIKFFNMNPMFYLFQARKGRL